MERRGRHFSAFTVTSVIVFFTIHKLRTVGLAVTMADTSHNLFAWNNRLVETDVPCGQRHS